MVVARRHIMRIKKATLPYSASGLFLQWFQSICGVLRVRAARDGLRNDLSEYKYLFGGGGAHC